MKKWYPLFGLVTGLALFFIFINAKLGIFTLPFFWDELGVYSRAAIHQAVHGLGILPANLPDVLSRGHPMMPPFIFGAAFKFFGISLTVARMCGLTIYLIGVFFGYKILSQYTNKYWAAIFSFCIAIQPAFAAQAILVLPEMMLMTFTLASIYFYLKSNVPFLVFSLCLAILTKESALVLPIAFAIAHYQKSKKLGIPILAIPFGIFFLFLIIQKLQNGYFLYPLHEGLMDFNYLSILKKIWRNFHFIFIDQGRWGISLALLLFSTYHYKQKRQWIAMPSQLFWIVVWIALGGIAFSSFNYFLERYTLFYLFPVLIVLFIRISKVKELLKYMVVSIALYFAIFNLDNGKAFVDTDFAYVSHVRAMEKGFEYSNNLPLKSVVGYNWPMIMTNWTNESGYHFPKYKIDEATPENLNQFDYIFLSDPGKEVIMRDGNLENLTHIKTFKVGYASVAVYKVKKD